MKIGILTFHSVLNYGAVLQCYALQRMIKSLGHDTSVIDFRPNTIVAPYRLFSILSQCRSIISKAKYFVYLLLISTLYYKRVSGFNNFLRKNIRLATPKESFDCIIYGSDQIWNPKITHNIQEYWGAGCLSASRRVSYAASVGNLENLNTLSQREIESNLQNFDCISVREDNLAEYLRQFTNNTLHVTCDPVILNPKEDWIRLCEENKNQSNKKFVGKYIFVYNLTAEEPIEKIVEQVKRATGFRVIEFRGGVCIDDRRFPERDSSGSPIDFVNAIRNAAFVVTSSFHGLAFSLIFGRKFIVYSIHNTDRMKQLLKMTDLEYRFSSNFSPNMLNDIGIEKVDEAFAAIQAESLKFLKNALQSPIR